MKVLVISVSNPFPPTSGGSQRTYNILNALDNLGHEVHLRIITDTPDQQYYINDKINLCSVKFFPRSSKKKNLAGVWRKILAQGLGLISRIFYGQLNKYRINSNTRASIEHEAKYGDYDLTIFRYLESALIFRDILGKRSLVDIDDIESENQLMSASLEKTVFHKIKHIRNYIFVRILEKKFISRCHGIWLTKSDDIQKFHAHCENIIVLPNIPFNPPQFLDNSFFELTDSKKNNILFVSSFSWAQNIAGIDSFIKEDWPTVLREHPEATLTLVGNGMTKEMKEKYSMVKGVIPIGFVDDLYTFYQNSLFTIAPIKSGSGSNIKVIESLAMGRVSVSSKHGARGFSKCPYILYPCSNSISVIVVDLLKNPVSTLKAGLDAHQHANSNFNFAEFEKCVGNLIKTYK